MTKILLIIRSLRPKQWIKNMFVLMPFIFGGKLTDTGIFYRSLWAFIFFSMASSSIYLLNDITDAKADRCHPSKKNRPIASGALARGTALAVSIALIAFSLFFSSGESRLLALVIAAYFVSHIMYALWLKHRVIIDVIVIALGFEFRILAGCAAGSIVPSTWLQLCVFLLALFLAFNKRKSEKRALENVADRHRSVLSAYRDRLLDKLITISASLCIVFYGLYTISPDVVKRTGTTGMAYTIPFVIYGIFRYLYITDENHAGEDPGEVLVSDIPLIMNILIWLAISVFIFYRPFPL